jgi:cytoskeletal protein CcmA (bactofilin family)
MIRKVWLKILGPVTTAAIALSVTATHEAAVADEPGISNVNSSIHIASGERSGNLSTVNGSIHIGENAVVGHAKTVNGSVNMEAHSTAAELGTVNGPIKLEEGAHVNGDVHTVNGTLHVDNSAEVTGNLTSVNGGIGVAAAHIGGSVGTASSSMDLGPNAQIDGDVNMSKDTSWHFGFQRIPRVVIEPGTVVKGKLHFERPVVLYVSDHAKIGVVEGAKVQKFSGDHPPE